MTLAQLCCTCWALAALAQLGLQGPESVPTDQLNFLAVACIDVFPASRKRCEKVSVFGAQNPTYSEMSGCLNVIIFGEKGVLVVVADVHSYRLFHCPGIWIFPVGNKNLLFLLCEYSRSRKAVCKSRYISYRYFCD
jgi:hypothetical protein